MNYLAHMLCSNDSPQSMLGNFIADFVKGDVEGRFPREVVEGISRRVQRENALDTAIDELLSSYDLLRDHFHSFFLQVLARFRTNSARAVRWRHLTSTAFP